MKTNTIDDILARTHIDANGCRIWDGYLNRQGYGRTRFGNKLWLVHRLVYQHSNGDIPKGFFVCHRCDVPSCCNLDHLFIGTSIDNIRDAQSKKRLAVGTKNQNSKLSEQDIPVIVDRYNNGESIESLAKHYGIQKCVLAKVISGKSWKHVERADSCHRTGAFKSGDEHHNRKLNSSQVAEIVSLRKSGLTLQKIADRFGIGLATTSQICSGKRWSSVTLLNNPCS